MGTKQLSRRAFLRSSVWTVLGTAVGCVAPESTSEPATATATMPPPTETAAPTSTPEPTSTPTTVPPTIGASTKEAPSSTPGPTATVPPEPTATTPPETPTSAPTATEPPPTPTPLVVTPSREDLLAHYPQAGQSVVSLVHHEGVWSGDQIVDHAVLEMLDAALLQLTGLNDALGAWQVLFDPQETIGIKVNTISRYTTTPQVAYGVARRLQEAGVPAEQIVIFDRTDRELIDRGYTINVDGPGVRCRGAKSWDQPAKVTGTTQRIHDVMLSCDALINIPALKEHGISGFTSALKNHYGTISNPGALHPRDCDPYIPDLNALPVIRDKTRLVIGDFIRICPYGWERMVKEHKIAMSFDPVAHDFVARQVLLDRQEADGRVAGHIMGKSHYLDTAVGAGLGADPDHTELRRIQLG